ncbi:MAG TPA: EamA family transporter [Candidatus Angelobacter sp.]|jgi:drug/metabolite transporter (DMT)-like permease|nr:EamA family transporter [Candidatus Angelobacter sp.]
MSHHVLEFGLILLLVLFNSGGDLLMARAMRRVGDVDALRKNAGIPGVIKAVLTTPLFYAALLCMAAGYFSLLTALSRLDLSVVIPAVSSVTYLTTLLGARFFLREHLDRRRWVAGLVVLGGVVLLALD